MSIGFDKVTFSNNLVETSSAAGALRFQVTNKLSVTGNMITATASATGAIRIDNSSNFVCNSNNITGVSGSGIYVATASSGKIADNKIDTFTNAVTLSATVCNDVHVTDNQCLNISSDKVSNSSTGTGVAYSGNYLPAKHEFIGFPLQVMPYTTAGRPSASVAGTGGMYFDVTLGKPLWSSGTGWFDAAGTLVP